MHIREGLFLKLATLQELRRRRDVRAASAKQDKPVVAARESFAEFRRFVRPELVQGWWRGELELFLQRWADDYAQGRAPKALIQSPPQHGKSEAICDFAAWCLGRFPDAKQIFASYADSLGRKANRHVQRVVESEAYARVFPDVRMTGTSRGDDARTQTEFGVRGRRAAWRNVTVRGGVTGHAMDIGIVDDPFKNRAEANSTIIRETVWEWFTNAFLTRRSRDAGLIIIMTRWHVDDLAARALEKWGDEVRVFSFPAIAIADEQHRKQGDALFPEFKPLPFLAGLKSTMSSYDFEALYQQKPVVEGGNLIKSSWFKRYDVQPALANRYIYADTALKTKEANDYSVLECWGLLKDRTGIVLLDVLRGKWESPELERRTKEFWAKHHAKQDWSTDGALVSLVVEEAASGTGLVQSLKAQSGLPVRGITRSKDKYTRAMDVLGYLESGRVGILAGEWNSDFLTECESFTGLGDGHDDQVDPMLDAVQELLVKPSGVNAWADFTIAKQRMGV